MDLCRRVGAEPLYCVNFLGDAEQRYRHTPEGDRNAFHHTKAPTQGETMAIERPNRVHSLTSILPSTGNPQRSGVRRPPYFATVQRAYAHDVRRSLEQMLPAVRVIGSPEYGFGEN